MKLAWIPRTAPVVATAPVVVPCVPRLPTQRRLGHTEGMPLRGVVSTLVVLLAVITGCSAGGGPSIVTAPDWMKVDLPDNTTLGRLSTDGYSVIAGGRRGSGPFVGVIDDDQLRPVRLVPRSPYAKTAEIVSLARSGDQLVALGNVHGGAHGNSRWTVWRGSTDRILEQPQSLGTFGGTDGGDLVEIMINSSGPMIIGSRRFDDDGLDPAGWLPEGDRWRLQPSAGTALDGTATEQKSVRTGLARTDRMILVGSTLELTGAPRQQAAGWVRTGSWEQFTLPDSGERSEATAIACAPPGPRQPQCMITGSDRDRLAGWWLSDDVGEQITDLPDAAVSATGPPARPMITAELAGVAYQTDTGAALAMDTGAGWQRLDAPSGDLIDAVAVGPSAYLLMEHNGSRRLWRAIVG